ncbi:MAG: toxic anion resistance protein, partial [Lachnospiraceae bacterium]
MAEITLNALRKQKIAAEENIALVEENARKIQEQITALTPAEREKVEEIKEQIDLTDSQMLMQYGSGAKQNIADFSENILNNVRNKDTGYIGELMTGLVTSVQGLDFESLEKESGIMGIFKKAEAKVKRFMMQYEKLEVQVDKIEGKLDEARMEMLKDIGMLDSMYEKNLSYFRQLQLYIVAGEEKMRELKEETIPALRKEAEESGDPMNAQVVKDFEDTVG